MAARAELAASVVLHLVIATLLVGLGIRCVALAPKMVLALAIIASESFAVGSMGIATFASVVFALLEEGHVWRRAVWA